ncbi:uncharacterized protein DSM5745_07758 [Aspergillus mulundensis]|uniref:F-box domain-containing protein n=1 Tax=Aspergillus mulundensis TaxID=1810919 RepID=A0A3D8RF50_9EURO|nr:hypothetical protein DSM5745_07758 [Aspergillus mulundensis]RDW72586.1 hypothetical protein DSM5745_07758 [Aspergillus mulundensis]
MSNSTPHHKIFSIPELVEAILLETDPRTLLTSAQRVCRLWNDLIKNKDELQQALFFKPSRKASSRHGHRQMNPLIPRLWHELFRRKGFATPKYFLPLDPIKAEAYQRPNASWRRMLLYQPPEYRLGIIEYGICNNDAESAEFSELKMQMDETGLRLRHINELLEDGRLVAGCDPLILWTRFGPLGLKHAERKYRDERQLMKSKYALECDVFVFCYSCDMLAKNYRNQSCMEGVENGVENWVRMAVKANGPCPRYRNREPLWEDEEVCEA